MSRGLCDNFGFDLLAHALQSAVSDFDVRSQQFCRAAAFLSQFALPRVNLVQTEATRARLVTGFTGKRRAQAFELCEMNIRFPHLAERVTQLLRLLAPTLPRTVRDRPRSGPFQPLPTFRCKPQSGNAQRVDASFGRLATAFRQQAAPVLKLLQALRLGRRFILNLLELYPGIH